MFMSLNKNVHSASTGLSPAAAQWVSQGSGAASATVEPQRLVTLSECDVSSKLMSEYGAMLECEVWCTDGCVGRVHRVLIDQEENAPYLALQLGAADRARLTLVPMEWIGGLSHAHHRVYVNTQKQVIAEAPAWDGHSIPRDAVLVVDDYFERHADAYDALACLF